MRADARPATTLRVEGWSDDAFARVAEVVHGISGLVFPPNRQPLAEAGMRRAMSSLRISRIASLELAVLTSLEAQAAVLAELTVGETYFFREAVQLDLLRSEVLPPFLRRTPTRPLRIWSAGCATGEEPYSIAMLLREESWPHGAHILGTDVAQPRLEAARHGRYTEWSMRGMSPGRIARWFDPRGKQFQLHDEIRSAVEFAPLNLLNDRYPGPETGGPGHDLVLCRNVLIYFDMAAVVRVATRLLASLAPDGWLFLGASDPPLAELVPCEMVLRPGGAGYRRADRDPHRGRRVHTSVPTAPSRWTTADALPADHGAWSEPDASGWATDAPGSWDAPSVASTRESAPVPPPPEIRPPAARPVHDEVSREHCARRVRQLANAGHLREAEDQCVRALDLHRDDTELHLLHATVLGAGGQHRAAVLAARRALYFDGHCIMASLQLGDSLARLGQAAPAIRAFENAVEALAAAGDAAVVPYADGLPAAHLRHVAQLRLRTLKGSAA